MSQRPAVRLVVGAMLLMGLLYGTAAVPVAQAATLSFTVNTTADTDDAKPGDGVCADSNGKCSLRAAAEEASSAATASVVSIGVPAGNYTLTQGVPLTFNNQPSSSTVTVTVTGAGANSTTINANNTTEVLYIYTTFSVAINGITITGGNTSSLGTNVCGGGIENFGILALDNVVVSGNHAAGCGGGIVSSGTINLVNTVVRNNTAVIGGGGLYSNPSSFGPPSTTTISSSTFSGNTTTDNNSSGGGITNANSLSLTASTISGNTSPAAAGIVNIGATGTITASTISGNSSDALENLSGNLALTNSTISGNGSLAAVSAPRGCALPLTPRLTIVTKTIRGVEYHLTSAVLPAPAKPGSACVGASTGNGVFSVANGGSSSTLTLTNVTVASNAGGIYNQAGTLSLRNSIDANTNATSNCTGAIADGGYNLDSGTTCGFGQATDLSNKDPLLGALAINGGTTQTMALAAGSPAINAGGTAANGCPSTDQRGVPRPQGPACDIGAYEYNGNAVAPTVTGISPTSGPATGGTSVVITGTNLAGAVAVRFGQSMAQGFAVNSATQVTATSSAGADGQTVDVTVTTAGGSSATSGADQFTYTAPPPSGPGGRYTPVQPTRLLDSRPNTQVGPYNTPWDAGTTRTLQISNNPPLPPSGVSAVVLNVSVTDTTYNGDLTLYPTGGNRPLAANLTWTMGETISCLVEVAVGADGQIAIVNDVAQTDVVIDVEGYVGAPGAAPPHGSVSLTPTPTPKARAPGGTSGAQTVLAGLYTPLTVPIRIMDTRPSSQVGAYGTPFGAGTTRDLLVTGLGGVPQTGVSAVILDVAVTDTVYNGDLTVYPQGTARPLAASLTWTTGRTIVNRVIVPVSSSGQISIVNDVETTDVIVDLNGWFTDATGTAGTRFVGASSPTRLLDSRANTEVGPYNTPWGPGTSRDVPVTGVGPVPASGVSAVVLSVTATDTTALSNLTVYPAGTSLPMVSDLNWPGGATISNLVVVAVGVGGQITLTNVAGSVDFVIDVVGWYS